MRLMQLVPLYDSYRVFLRELTRALEAEGHAVRTLCRIGEGNTIDFDPADTTCRHFPLPRGQHPLRHLRTARALREEIDDFRPDVVHAHFSAAILTAALARSRDMAGIRFMGTFQGLQFPVTPGMKGRFLRGGECWAASHMDEVWVLTDDDAEALRRHAPRAEVVRQESSGFGCHDRFFDTPFPDSGERASRRRDAGLDPEAVVLIFIGRLVAHKGFHLAARAFMQAHERRPELRWLVIGERDPLHSSGLTEAEWGAFRNHPAIHWLRTQDNVLPWLDLSDAMLFPTAREGMPVSVMEALARRVPVLTNKVRGCRELIEDGVNGRFFREATVEAIREVLVQYQPQPGPPGSPRLRRSNWVNETCRLYADS